jgi:subtilisin family serine protease
MNRAAAFILVATLLVGCSDNPSPAAPQTQIASPPSSLSRTKSAPIPGRYIVVFKGNVPNVASLAATLAAQHQATIGHVYTTAIKGVALALSDADAAAMRLDPNVAFVEQDQVVTLQSTQTNATWGIDRTDQRALPLNSTYVYNADGTGVTAYIIDTGINYTHTEFGGRAVKGIDEVTAGGTAADCHGHGTGVASLVGGAKYGVAKNVRLVAVRVVDCGANVTTSTVLAGVDWVTAHRMLPAVANMSMTVNLSAALTLAIEASISSGVVYAVAAGNNANDACTFSPANTPNALTVGATNITDHLASFSSFGPCVDINAPGENIRMAWSGSTTATKTSDGTSFASPHVAGTAALYLQAHPTATPAQVRSALVSNATSNALIGVPANTPNLLAYSGFIVVGTPPVANFAASCSALACSFDGSSTTALSTATYAWTFGDTKSGSGKTLSHTYSAAGTYTVTLTVTDANGTSTKTKTVSVSAPNQPPVARFNVSCLSLACLFDGSASSDDAGIVSYAWTWGDGRSETHAGATAKNAFLSPNTFSVTLTVTDGSGQKNSVTASVQVTSASNHAPTASMSLPVTGATFVQGTSVSFAGSGSDQEDGALTGTSLSWTSSIDGLIGTGASLAKNNLSVGSHVITLTAKDVAGATGSATRNITITAPPPVNQAPVSRFTWTCAGAKKCALSGSASTDDVGVVSYAWDWGDGRAETHAGAGANNTWATPGTYVVKLTVKDASGLTGTSSQNVIVK